MAGLRSQSASLLSWAWAGVFQGMAKAKARVMQVARIMAGSRAKTATGTETKTEKAPPRRMARQHTALEGKQLDWFRLRLRFRLRRWPGRRFHAAPSPATAPAAQPPGPWPPPPGKARPRS